MFGGFSPDNKFVKCDTSVLEEKGDAPVDDGGSICSAADLSSAELRFTVVVIGPRYMRLGVMDLVSRYLSRSKWCWAAS